MQFGVLIFINIILWALFYLVISLKLERSASEFREKKFRREMDEVIREFNETAERNISILENRIAIMKKLLANTGALRSVDISLMDEKDEGLKTPDVKGPRKSEEAITAVEREKPRLFSSTFTNEPAVIKEPAQGEPGFTYHASMLVRTLSEKAIKVRNGALEFIYARLSREEHPPGHTETRHRKSALQSDILVNTGDHEYQVEREKRNAGVRDSDGDQDAETPGLRDDEISDMFQGSDDKYALAAELYRKGYPLDTLSRCSSIPAGEIKLVLNLNESK